MSLNYSCEGFFSFAQVKLLGEHMKTPMRGLQDVMSIPIFDNF